MYALFRGNPRVNKSAVRIQTYKTYAQAESDIAARRKLVELCGLNVHLRTSNWYISEVGE